MAEPNGDLWRVAAGASLAVTIAATARRAQSLSGGGALAAIVLGTLAAGAGWGWAALLVAYFASGSALSRAGRAAKAARTGTTVAKGGARDARQVLANGGVFGAAALAHWIAPHDAWGVLAAGSLAASAADTWGTEIGTWIGGTPRDVRTWRPVAAGMSGAVSAAGTAATVAGAAAIAGLAVMLGWPAAAFTALLWGGIVGAIADTLAGATLQERRRCDGCGAATEQDPHACGAATRRIGGVRGIGNDAVNLLATVAGGVVAVAWWSVR